MADGYARASGKAGVVLAGQNGPGATNLVTGLAQAKAAYSPVVSIAGASRFSVNSRTLQSTCGTGNAFLPRGKTSALAYSFTPATGKSYSGADSQMLTLVT